MHLKQFLIKKILVANLSGAAPVASLGSNILVFGDSLK